MSTQENEKKELSAEEQRKRLERRANVVRSRLLRAVDALDTRRHQVTEIGAMAKAAAPRIGLSVLGVTAAVAIAGLSLRSYLKSRRERAFAYRAKRLLGAFPLRVEKKPSFFAEAFQKIAMTAITVIVTEATRRSVTNVVDGRFPDGRLAVGEALQAHQQR